MSDELDPNIKYTPAPKRTNYQSDEEFNTAYLAYLKSTYPDKFTQRVEGVVTRGLALDHDWKKDHYGD